MDLWDENLVCAQCGKPIGRDQPRLISLGGYRIGERAPQVPLYALHDGDCLREWVAHDPGEPGGGADLGGALSEDGEI